MQESAIDWVKVRSEELQIKGYSKRDIELLNLLDEGDLPIDILSYYLKNYIHNVNILRSENERLEKVRIELVTKLYSKEVNK